MTVQANLPPTNTNSDGVTATFNYDFKVTREEHLAAMYTVIATGETGDLEIDSVTGVGNDGGGTVTFATAPPDGMIVTVDSIAPLSQIEAFTGNKLPPATVERMGDAIAIQNQRQQSQIERSVRFPPSDEQIPTLPARAQRADKILGFSPDGNDFAMIEGAAASQAYVDQAEAQANRAVAAATYPYTSGEQKTGAFMPGAGESLTLFTYNNSTDVAVTIPALSGLPAGYNIGICRTAGSGAQTISATDGALINGAASIVHDSDYLCLDFTVNEAGDEWVAVDKAVIGPPIGTSAGDVVALDSNGKLPAVNASQLVDVRDYTARDTAITAYVKADINSADPFGIYGALISDNFISDSLSVKTNANYNASDDYYDNSEPGVNRASGVTPTSNKSTTVGTLSLLTDGSTAAFWQGSGVTSAGDYLQFNLGASYSLDSVRIYRNTGGGGGDCWAAVTVKASATGSFSGEETTIGSGTITAGTGYFDISVSGSGQHIRIESTDGSVVGSSSANEPVIYEVQIISVAAPSNMTLRPSASTLQDADPLDMTVYFRVEDIDSVIEGTDRIIKVSIDGGATWETCDITVIGAWGADDTLIRAEGDVSAQTGSSFLWELTTANNKEQRIKQVVSVPSY